MELYEKMDFASRIKSNLANHPNNQVKNYILMMCKITWDFYKDHPIKCTRWMDFEVILPLRGLLGKRISVEITESQDIKVIKF